MKKNMIKDKAVKFLIKEFLLNRILANSLLLKTKKREFSREFLKKIYKNHLEMKAKPFVKWVGGRRQPTNSYFINEINFR